MKPESGFEAFRLDERLYQGIRALGYDTPTPIQAAAIPPALAGRDVLGLAQTGTGKTAAFAIPAIQTLLQASGIGLRALVLAPTRELADQIKDEITELMRHTPLRSAVIYGGVNIRRQAQTLGAGVDFLVACPGRLLDLLDRGHVHLSAVQVLIVDEVDRMMDMGFLPDVRKIIDHLPQQRQTLLFSATMPDDVRRLADEALNRPAVIEIAPNAPVAAVEHTFFPVEEHLKLRLLVEILFRYQREITSVLIFARTKQRARMIYLDLAELGHPVALLEGDLTQHRRSMAIDGFRRGEKSILVATDIAARGIDVAAISHVINYDVPTTSDDYIHRIGRTGRAGAAGKAYTLITPAEAQIAQAIEAMVGCPILRQMLEGFPYDEPASTPARSGERKPFTETGDNHRRGHFNTPRGSVPRRERRSQHR